MSKSREIGALSVVALVCAFLVQLRGCQNQSKVRRMGSRSEGHSCRERCFLRKNLVTYTLNMGSVWCDHERKAHYPEDSRSEMINTWLKGFPIHRQGYSTSWAKKSLQKILEFGEIRIGQLRRRSDHTSKPLLITIPRLIRGKTYVFPQRLSHSDAIILKSAHHITSVLKQKRSFFCNFDLYLQLWAVLQELVRCRSRKKHSISTVFELPNGKQSFKSEYMYSLSVFPVNRHYVIASWYTYCGAGFLYPDS